VTNHCCPRFPRTYFFHIENAEHGSAGAAVGESRLEGALLEGVT
jgi:hypothetical protein